MTPFRSDGYYSGDGMIYGQDLILFPLKLFPYISIAFFLVVLKGSTTRNKAMEI